MNKHTPGPWFNYHRYVANDDGVLIHEWPKTSMAIKQKQINARLIAAAPELFEAVMHLMAAMPEDAREKNASVLFVARAAIAKATGEQS